MINNITIREYKLTDKDKVLEIFKRNVPKYFSESEITDFELYLEHEIEKEFVAESERQIIGAGGINYDYKSKIAKISWDFIDPKLLQSGHPNLLINSTKKMDLP
jgi:N-acetylglutamate synthase-like GNAT family acetyltransferase